MGGNGKYNNAELAGWQNAQYSPGKSGHMFIFSGNTNSPGTCHYQLVFKFQTKKLK